MTPEQLPHRLAVAVADGRSSLDEVPEHLRTLTEYQLGLLLGVRRARELNPHLGLAQQGGRMVDFEKLTEITKQGVRIGLRREFLHRRYRAGYRGKR